MKIDINPKIDCVFKAIFGSEENKDVLIHLLNAVLTPPTHKRISKVTILNPFNERTFENGKTSVVDIKATDSSGQHFQIEVQLAIHPALRERMLFTWADIYHRQLLSGEKYHQLKPTVSIWFLDENLFPNVEAFLHRFGLMERTRFERLTDHLDLHVIEMNKWQTCLGADTNTDADMDLWLEFLNCSRELDSDNLPEKFKTNVFKKAMSTLVHFTESDVAHDLYMRRMTHLSIENTWKAGLEEAHARADMEAQLRQEAAARADMEVQLRQEASARADEAVAKVEIMRKRMKDAGLDPDSL